MLDWLSAAEIAEHRPDHSSRDAAHLVLHHYGIESHAESLPSDRDQNFRIIASDGRQFVLKIVSSVTTSERLAFETGILQHLAGRLGDVSTPEIVPTRDGHPTFVTDEGRRGYLVKWIDGKLMGDARPHTRRLLEDLGRTTGELASLLAAVEGGMALIASPWDLMRAGQVVDQLIEEIPDAARRNLIARFRNEFEQRASESLQNLPQQVVHGDLNDYNLLVRVGTDGLHLTGILDVGDFHHSARVVDPVIAATYAALHWEDPVGAAAAVGGAYTRVLPLTEQELNAFFPLLTMRLCASVCISAHRQKDDPDDAYITISQQGAWQTLERMRDHPLDLAYYRLRNACGLTPCPDTERISHWIDTNTRSFASVCSNDLSDAAVHVLDLSVSSPAPYVLALEPIATREVANAVAEARAEVAIGRYDEVRLVYSGGLFEIPTLDGPLQRTVHLGVDVFLDPGVPIFAPLAGEVHGLADNAEELSYGPTVVLRHQPDGSPPFFTLYGHLHRADLDALEVGRRVAAGDRIGSIGDPSENGGWTPHLHFQIIADMLEKESDFPGVCAFQDRDVWTSICPNPYKLLGLTIQDVPEADPQHALRRRASLIAPSLSVSYDEPLLILRGMGTYMFDHGGRRYLDCVNNVNHLGHSHPAVARAVADQMRVLNTNTRYLHPTILEYAGRLTATLPESLSVCFFVNSGSEANDLALRLARAHTRRDVTVVVDAAYHGHLTSLIEISPYKFAGPGGSGPGPNVLVAPLPDVYRGAFRDADASYRYADSVAELFDTARDRGGAGAFISESLLSCGGQIELPAGYLKRVYEEARRRGVVCIADEVQVGFGRVGTHFWGFETQGVVPDIVTMGKPIGNGHPLAAVVTTPEIAASFDSGMEYFNTYGGNPVACAAGLAVLETVERDGLQAHALEVGTYLKDGLTQLMAQFPLIGDVRGRGLFLGVELVTDRDTRTPAPAHARYVINRGRRLGVLLSTDGPDHNVIKVKPPLVFDFEDADCLLDTLATVLSEDPAQP